MKYSKNRQKFLLSKTFEMCYLRHAEHHGKNRTSLNGLDQKTLYFDLLLTLSALDVAYRAVRMAYRAIHMTYRATQMAQTH